MSIRKQMLVEHAEDILRKHGITQLDRHPDSERASQGYLYTPVILSRVQLSLLRKMFRGEWRVKGKRERTGTALLLKVKDFEDRGKIVRGFSSKELANALHERFSNPLHNFLASNPGAFVHGVTATGTEGGSEKLLEATGDKLEKMLAQGIVSSRLARRAKLSGFQAEFPYLDEEAPQTSKGLAEYRPDMRPDTVWIELLGDRPCHIRVQEAWGGVNSAKIILHPNLANIVETPNEWYAKRFSTPSWFKSSYRYVKRRIPARYIIGIVLPYSKNEAKLAQNAERLKKRNNPVYSHEGEAL